LSLDTVARSGGPTGVTVKEKIPVDPVSGGLVGLELADTLNEYVPGQRSEASIVRVTVTPPAGTATGLLLKPNATPLGNPDRESE